MKGEQEKSVIFRAKNVENDCIYALRVCQSTLYDDCNLPNEDIICLDFANTSEIDSLINGLQQLKARCS